MPRIKTWKRNQVTNRDKLLAIIKKAKPEIYGLASTWSEKTLQNHITKNNLA